LAPNQVHCFGGRRSTLMANCYSFAHLFAKYLSQETAKWSLQKIKSQAVCYA